VDPVQLAQHLAQFGMNHGAVFPRAVGIAVTVLVCAFESFEEHIFCLLQSVDAE